MDDTEKAKRAARLRNAIQPTGGGGGGYREYQRPIDFPKQDCDFTRWLRFDSLPIEQACFVLLGWEPPPLEAMRFDDQYGTLRSPTWQQPPEYDDMVRNLNLSISSGSVKSAEITEYPYQTVHVLWDELVRWAKSKSFHIHESLTNQQVEPECQAAPARTAATPTPMVTESEPMMPAPDTQAGQDASVVAEPDLPKRVRSVDALNGLIEDAVFEVGTGASVASVSTVLFQWALDDAKPGRLLADTTDDILRFRDGRFTKEVKEKALKQRIRRYLKHQGS